MTLLELIQRAVSIAVQGMDSPVVRAAVEAAVEPLVPVVFAQAGDELAKTARLRTLLRRTKQLTFTNGVVQLPDDVLSVYADSAVLYDEDDTSKRYSLVSWEDMIRGELDSRLGHFAVEGEELMHVVEPGVAFNPLAGPNVVLRLTIPCSPEVPANITDPVDIPAEIIDWIVEKLAVALKPIALKAR